MHKNYKTRFGENLNITEYKYESRNQKKAWEKEQKKAQKKQMRKNEFTYEEIGKNNRNENLLN
jgi:hypothetical protein